MRARWLLLTPASMLTFAKHRVWWVIALAGVAVACSTPDVAGPPGGGTGVTATRPIVATMGGRILGDELLVRFRDGTTEDRAQAIAGSVGGRVVARAAHSRYHVLRFDSTALLSSAATTLRAHREVIEATFNHLCQGEGVGTSPSEPLQQYQWYFYGMGADPWLGLPRADGVTVAVLDSGVAYEDWDVYAMAPDLAEVDFAPGYDFVNDDPHPNDDQRHGTHVAGVIAASRGITPVARGATILPVKVLGADNFGTELALAEGIRFAVDEGADVINMSLSFPPGYFPSRLLQDAIEYASQHGVVMVAAAGNQGLGMVSFPAAFRDVVSVGATALPDGVDPSSWRDLREAFWNPERAPYSNHSWKIDLVAPAGRLDADLDGDGFPEAVLAQTFAAGDPTDFEYDFFAGTSQATALVSGVIAVMKARVPDLTPYEIRALLTESAHRATRELLSPELGRGTLQAWRAVLSSLMSQRERPRYHAQVAVTLHDVAGGVEGRAHVEILDAAGKPARDVEVYGQFTGAAFGVVSGRTDRNGIVQFTSAQLVEPYVLAFEVDGVGSRARQGARMFFDRPRGFFRIDARSLDLLSQFGVYLDGVGTSPSGEGTGGTGVGTSPSDPISGSGVGTSPSGPITLAFAGSLFGDDYRSTLLMPNFSWGLATVPMAVAVDEAWYLAEFPAAADRRVLSYGRGWGDSPLLFDVTSFPEGVELVVEEGESISLVVLTYTSGVGTSPSGVGTSPSYEGPISGQGVGTSPSIWVDATYGDASPLATRSYDELLAGWYLSGEVDMPAVQPHGRGLPHLGLLVRAVQSYFAFAPRPIAEPINAYGATLEAAGMNVAPALAP